MGTLILSGGGNAEQTLEINQYFVQGRYFILRNYKKG